MRQCRPKLISDNFGSTAWP